MDVSAWLLSLKVPELVKNLQEKYLWHIQRVKELEAFIRESEGHKIDCSLFTLFTPCDCGYDEARKALNL